MAAYARAPLGDKEQARRDLIAAGGAWRCEICGQPTRNRKPWCPKHVLHSPYAAEVARAEAARRSEPV